MSFQSASKPYKGALELQECLMEEARKDDCPPAVKPQIARAYCELEKLKRVMRGLPANTSQSIRADTPKKSRRQSQQVTAPIESEQDNQAPDPVTDEGRK